MIPFMLLFIVSILFCILYYSPLKPKNFPPGPRWLPLVGCAPQLRRLTRELGGYQHLALLRLAQEYSSPVLGLRLGGQLTVAVSGHEAVRQVFTKEEFEGRPDNFFIRMRCMGTRKGITCTDGPHWHEQRSFAVRHLRSLGLGRRTMEDLIQDQVTATVDKLDLKVGTPICPDFGPAIMSVLWTLTAGSQFNEGDQALAYLLELMHKRAQAFDMSGGVLAQFPWLRHVAPKASGYKLLAEVNQQLRAFFIDTISKHRQHFCPEEPRDLIEAYLKVIEDKKDDPTSTFTEEQLVMVCLDMFVAGATSTSNSLSLALLALSRHPQVQKKVVQQLNEVLGTSQRPELSHQSKLPYLSAVILESLRLYHVTPVAGPRRTLTDTEMLGYSIPKNTMILLNVWSVHNDPKHWGDPENFRPERFIDSEGKLKPDDWLMPFGLGRRRCLGEVLARGSVFLFLANLLQRYHVVSTRGDEPPPPPLPGLTLAPRPYTVILSHRM